MMAPFGFPIEYWQVLGLLSQFQPVIGEVKGRGEDSSLRSANFRKVMRSSRLSDKEIYHVQCITLIGSAQLERICNIFWM